MIDHSRVWKTLMSLHELTPKNSQNKNDFEKENDPSHTLRSEYANDNIECCEWEKDKEMLESVAQQRNARKGEASTERDHHGSCWRLLNALL
jgi:hypothetical protein